MQQSQPAPIEPSSESSLEQVIEALSRPSTYNYPGTAVERRETHISVVFLVGGYAYKIKKPVNLGFLDFTTLERRREACTREVMLNRRLAPDVYLGVIPITVAGNAIGLGGYGKVVEYAVCMRRLADEQSLAWRVDHGEVALEDLDLVARRLARFHDQTATGPEIARMADYAHIRHNVMENFEQTAEHVGLTVHPEVYATVKTRTVAALEAFRALFEARAPFARDTHGDFRLEHIYYGERAKEPKDVRVIDCIEFNDRFRYADPVSDVAFAVMELRQRGRDDLARRLEATYFRYRSDDSGRPLLAFYVAYRAVVRAKVLGIRAVQPHQSAQERQRARDEARAYWLVALSALAPPSERPAMLMTMGLPGTGKTTLAAGLAEQARAAHVSTDAIRQELAVQAPALPPLELHSDAWDRRVHEACVGSLEEALWRGGRLVLDGTFRRADERGRMAELSRRWGVPLVMLHCQADDEAVQARLSMREAGAADADLGVYAATKGRWQPTATRERHRVKLLPPRDANTVLTEALDALRSRDLL